MYNYLTSVYQEGDKRSVLISAIQALHFARHGIDIISKTPVSLSPKQLHKIEDCTTFLLLYHLVHCNFPVLISANPSFRAIVKLSITRQFFYLQVRTHFSRPNWPRVFHGLARKHIGERIGMTLLFLSNS